MKALYPILTVTNLLFSTVFLFAQITTEKASTSTVITRDKVNEIPFQQGNWELMLVRPNINYSHWKNSQEGVSLGTQYDLGVDLCTNYFVADRLGIGLELEGDWTGTHYNGTDNSNSKYMVYGDIMYGLALNRNLGIFARGAVGFGSDKVTYKSGGTSTSTTDNLFGYKGTLGLPIRVFDNGPIYLTPWASYNYLQTSFDGGKLKDNGARIGLGFEAYMGCHQFSCDCRHHFENSNKAYLPGTSFFDMSTKGRFKFGTDKITYAGSSTSTQEETYTNEALKLGYYIYVLPNFAIGGNVELGGSMQKDKSSSNKVTSTNWLIAPMVEFHLPVDNGWNNLFLMGGVGFGSQKNTSNSGTSSTSTKDNIFSYDICLGYNDFIAKRLSLTPKFGYEWRTFKNTTNNVELKSDGFEGELGLRLYLGPRWKF